MSKESIAQSVHQRLLNLRDQTGESFHHLLMRYGLERFLYRLVAAGYEKTFVLKGAMLFALWQDVPGRPTRDIDFLGFGELDHERLRRIISEICRAKVVDDGLRFDVDSIQTDDIREDQEYHGIRVRLSAFLGKARLAIQIDVGFGDALTPEPVLIDYPVILDFPSPHIKAYHPATVIAEKLNAMVVLGIMNSRIKDFYDVYLILKHMNVDEDELEAAIQSTFQRRNIELPQKMPVAFTPDFLEDGLKETQWRAFLQRSMLAEMNLSFAEVITELREKLWPVLLRIQRQ
jgi:predicted nucleotidyltransferase component of viral defense system